jgi:serine/threonine protein kinase
VGRADLTDADAVAQRLLRVHEVLDSCIARRLDGKPISDEQLIAEHPELMPELAHELRGLGLIERARRSATARSRNGRSSSAGAFGSAGAAHAPSLIPGYETLAPIHSGAQGVVYKALQRSTQRTVAIKVMRDAAPEGLRELSRFEREVQILATLRHPNIVSIHDSGLTPDGRAFFVMDYIDGVPLDQWVQTAGFWDSCGKPATSAAAHASARGPKAKTDEFLRLFVKICDAIHAAHLRGVIHRDIKPGNIRIDSNGEPHVLDFGLAKTVGQAADPEMTVTGQFIGSLPWSSPEQADGAIEKIDVRTDVYALGVLLFQGLTGQFPYDINGPMRDVLERIISAEPKRPSSFARPNSAAPSIDDELDTIVLKCLSKERDRRYQSAGELARDIRAHLIGEPIEARRNSAFYMLRKRLTRYRAALAAGLSLTLIVSALAAYAAFQAKQNRDRAISEQIARREAEEATRQADSARQEAGRLFEQASVARLAETEQRRLSEREAERARSVTDFLVRTLGMADPDVTQASDLTIKSILDRTSGEIEATFADQPTSEATVRLVIGRAYAALGELESALPHLERAYAIRREEDASDRRQVYDVLLTYVQVLDDLGDERWREVWWELVRANRARLAADVPQTAVAIERAANLLNADTYAPKEVNGLVADIKSTFEASVPRGDPRWMLLADWLTNYGGNHGYRQRPGPACELLRDALEIQRELLPETNTRVVRTLASLVEFLIEDGQFADAERITLDALSKLSVTLSADHWYVAALRTRLAASLIGLGRLDEAEAILSEATRRLDAGLADSSRHRIHALSCAAWLAEARGQSDRADQLHKDVARRLSAEFREANRYDLLRYAVSPAERARLKTLNDLTTSVRASRTRFDRTIRATFAAQRALFADDDPRASFLGDLYYRVARVAEKSRGVDAPTIRLFEEAERLTRASTCINPWKRACTLFGLGLAHEARQEYVEGETCARRALAIVEPQFGEKLGFACSLRSLLSACIAGQGRYEEAAPIALQAFETLLKRFGASNYETRTALERVASLAAATGRPQDALPSMRRLSRDYKVPWTTLRPAFAACYPDLAREIDSLARVQSRDAESISAAVARVLEARKAAFDTSNPDAILYQNAAYDFTDGHLSVKPDPAWAPLMRDFLEVESARFDAPRRIKASRLWWCAVVLVEGGAYAEAEPVAREACEITRRFDAAGARAHAGRAVVLARALAGQDRTVEALSLLESSQAALVNRMDNRNAVQFVAAVLEVYPRAGRPPAVAEILVPFCEKVLAESKDATFMNHLVTRLVAQPQLDPALRALSVELARRATELRPKDPVHWNALSLAVRATGDDGTANEILERAHALESSAAPD